MSSDCLWSLCWRIRLWGHSITWHSKEKKSCNACIACQFQYLLIDFTVVKAVDFDSWNELPVQLTLFQITIPWGHWILKPYLQFIQWVRKRSMLFLFINTRSQYPRGEHSLTERGLKDEWIYLLYLVKLHSYLHWQLESVLIISHFPPTMVDIHSQCRLITAKWIILF